MRTSKFQKIAAIIRAKTLTIAVVALIAPLALVAVDAPLASAGSATNRSSSDEGYINPGPNSSDMSFEAGAYIIDSGAQTGTSPQTVAQGLKQYGLVYALVKNKIPVQWVINSAKPNIDATSGNIGTDFSYDCDGPSGPKASKNYKSGAFVVAAEFAAQAKSTIDSWVTANPGLTVDGPCSNPFSSTLPVFATIKSWPRAVLDAQNGSVAVTYYNNAGISQGSTTDPANPPAYRTASPSQLTSCDDMYIMPHADPTYATHSGLIDFVNKGGDLYASCHAVSVLENITYPAGVTGHTAGSKAMNFLSTNGLVNYDQHSSQGSPAYTYGAATAPGDPVAQFVGKTDLAMQSGSEQIFIPSLTAGSGSTWRPTTRVLVYDQTQANVGGTVSNPKNAAAAIVYGPAFGDINAGLVMYQGGHSVAKGTADDVAAQRAFWNFQLLASVNSSATPSNSDRTPTVVMTESATTSASINTKMPISGYAIGGSGSYKYTWASSCYQGATQVSSGTFGDASKADTTFQTPNVTGQISCNLTLTVIDTCGRYAFGYQTVSIAPSTNVRISQSATGSSYVGMEETFTAVVTNDGIVRGTTTGDGNYASSVYMKSATPANASLVRYSISGSAPAGASCYTGAVGSSSGVICNLKDMTDEQSVTIVIVVKPTATGTLTNTVTATTLSYDTDLSDNSASTAITAAEDATIRPALTITKDPSNQSTSANGTAAFKITVTNTTSGGNITLTNITLTDNFTTGGTLTCSEGGVNVFDAATTGSTYVIPSLARGVRWEAACVISGAFASGSATSGTNTLNASFSYGGSSYSASSGAVTITKLASALKITKTATGTLRPGGTLTYKIRVENTSGAQATNVVLGDTLPLGVTVQSVSATNVNNSIQETATPAVIAFEKFNGTTSSSGQGWASSSWSIANGGGTAALSTSSNTSGLASPMNVEVNSMLLKGTPTQAGSFSRTVALSNKYKSVTLFFECASLTSGPTLKVTIDTTTTLYEGKCTSTRGQISATIPTSVFATSSNKVLKFESVANSWSGTSAIAVDDIFLLGGYAAGDQFVSGFSSQQGFNSNLTPSNTDTWTVKSATSLIGSSSNYNGTFAYYKPNSSTRYTATLQSSFYYDPAKYAALQIAFTCSLNSNWSGSDQLKLELGTTSKTTIFTEDGTKCLKSSGAPSDSMGRLETISVTSSLLPSTAGNITFTFTGYSKRDLVLDDIFFLVKEKGSTTATLTYTNLDDALKGPYTLAAGEVKEISYTVKVDAPYTPNFLTGLVNTAWVTSNQQSTPSYSIISTPFVKAAIALTKTASATLVASGGSITYTYRVTNKGSAGATLDTITVSDPGCSPISTPNKQGDSATVLAAGKYWEYTCTVTNLTSDTSTTASVSATDNLGDPQNEFASASVKVSSPALTITVTPTSKNIYSGNTVTYAYSVRNTGNAALKDVGISAANCSPARYRSGDNDGDYIMSVDDVWIFACTTGAITNNQTSQAVTAHGTDAVLGGAAVNSSAVNVAITVYDRPNLVITKTVRNTGPSPSGPASSITVLESNTVVYTYTVRVETASVSSLRVNDTGCSVPSSPSSGDTGTTVNTLEVGEVWVFSCTAGQLLYSETATVTASGVDGVGSRVQSDEVSTYVDVTAPSLLTSVVPGKDYILSGAIETYTYTIENIGGATFSGFSALTDTACAISDAGASTHTLAPGEKWSFTCSVAASGSTMVNHFNATGTYSGSSSYSPAEATAIVFVMNPRMTVQKLAQVYKGTTSETRTAGFQSSVTAAYGDRIVFKYIVTAGEVVAPAVAGINSIVLTAINDSDCQIATFAQVKSGAFNVGDTNSNGAIDKDEAWQFTCTAMTSVTANSVTASTPTASPVTLEAAPTLETTTAGIGLRMAGVNQLRDYFTASGAVVITVVPGSESLPSKFRVASAVVPASSKNLVGNIPGKNLSETSSATVTIDPTIINHSLIYDANGGAGTPPDTQFGSGVVTVSDQGGLTRTGYTFSGWYTTRTGSGGTAYSVGSSYTLSADLTLYAVWIAHVSYDANGADTGTVTNDATNYLPGATATISTFSPQLAKTGATFAGWNTAADGTGTHYSSTGTLTISGDITLYAEWTVALSYDVNGGTGTPPATVTGIRLGGTATVADKSGTMANGVQNFVGWNTQADGNGTDYGAGNTTSQLNSNTTLYAVWTNSPVYRITYILESATSGSVPTDPQSYLANTGTYLKMNSGNLAKSGANFAGWICGGVSYDEGAAITVGSANITCQPRWVNTYSISYTTESSTAGSAPVDGTNYSNGSGANLLGNSGNLERTGYTFNGWLCNGVSYAVGASITISGANIVCSPIWQQNGSGGSTGGSGSVTANYTLILDPNFQGPTPKTQNGNGNITLLPNTYVRPGFIFKGWSRNSAGPVQINDGGTLNISGDLTLYAIWEAEPVVTPVTPGKPVTLTLNSNCAPRTSEKQTNAGMVKLNSNTFTCNGYAFAGWSTSPTGTVEYLDKALYNFVAPGVLYAVWIKTDVAQPITKGEYRFEVFFGMNSVVITAAEKKNIAGHIAMIKKKAGAKANFKIVVEGWVQPNPNPGNIKFLSTYRAKHVAALMVTLGLKGAYKELYKGLGADNMPEARHASVIVTWSK
jgi:uncharacterized repeat protein (TIGR01451 family)/uncharacterized repeat protein (TIGR02543 family)